MEKLSLKIPKIDVTKIINERYFIQVKKDFNSYDSCFENQSTYEEFISDPNPNLKDTITIRHYTYEHSDEFEEGTSVISSGEIINKEYLKDIECDFYTDFLIPGIEKGKRTYLIVLKKEIKERINHKDTILTDLFSYKKNEIKSVLLQNTTNDKKNKIEDFINSTCNNILDEINLIEEKYFPSPKLNLSLNKSECLLLFYALYEKGVLTNDITRADLGRFIDRNITYKKDNKNHDIKYANDSLSELLPSKKTKTPRQSISLTSLERLQKIEESLFDFLKK